MYAFDYIDENSLRAANHYPGLIAVLIYNPAAKVFERQVENAYVELHELSGEPLLIAKRR